MTTLTTHPSTQVSSHVACRFYKSAIDLALYNDLKCNITPYSDVFVAFGIEWIPQISQSILDCHEKTASQAMEVTN